MIRLGRDDDSPGAIELIRRCWSEYPGVILDVEREEPGLLAPATYYRSRGGELWVVEEEGALIGLTAATPAADGWQVNRVYVHPEHHGAGLGHALLDTAEAHAVANGATRLSLWTDTRFDRAHRFYEKRGYVRHGPIRALDDLSNSLEFAYAKPVDGVWRLDAAAAASAVPGLAAVLRAEAPGASSDARERLAEAARAVAQGRILMLAGWAGAALAGTVRVALVADAGQEHRAELEGLVVHPAQRRRGLGRALVEAAEAAAREAGRRLLTLHAPAGSAAARLYAALGWTEIGTIPGFARGPDGAERGATIFYKNLT